MEAIAVGDLPILLINPDRIRLAHSEAIENLSNALDACATERGGLDKSNRFYVYAYLDPRESGIFEYICPSGMRVEFDHKPIYIGKGQGKRINDHTFDYDLSAKTQKSRILKKMIASGMSPIKLKIVNQCSEACAFAHEIDLIAGIGRLKNGEGSLLNITVGGEGVVGLKFSEESRARMREAQRKRFEAETAEQKRVRAERSKATKAANPEVEAERRRKIAAHNSKEDVRRSKSEIAKKQHERMTQEEKDWINKNRSEGLRRANAARTPEQRTAMAKKTWETRRRNSAIIGTGDS
jgi:hypothetical protein